MKLHYLLAALCLSSTASSTFTEFFDAGVEQVCIENLGIQGVLKYKEIKNITFNCISDAIAKMEESGAVFRSRHVDPLINMYQAICRYKSDLVPCAKEFSKAFELCTEEFDESDKQLMDKSIEGIAEYVCSRQGEILFVELMYEARRRPWSFMFCFHVKVPQGLISCYELANWIEPYDECRLEELFLECMEGTIRSCKLPRTMKFVEAIIDSDSKLGPCSYSTQGNTPIRNRRALPFTNWKNRPEPRTIGA